MTTKHINNIQLDNDDTASNHIEAQILSKGEKQVDTVNDYTDYITVLRVKAKKVINGTTEEYSVILENGKKIIIGKETFENQYISVGDMNAIQDKDITNIVHKFILKPLDEKSVIGVAILKTGFRVYATVSSLVTQIDRTKGKQLCKEKLIAKIRAFYSFLIQWAKYGLRYHQKFPDLESADINFIDLTDIDE